MFKYLSNKLSYALNKISNYGRLTEKNIEETLQGVKTAFLEADVALSVISEFIENVKLRALGQEIGKSLTPGQTFIKIVRAELINIMGNEDNSLNLMTQPPAVILITGPKGGGKTTTVGKLGNFLYKNKKKKVLLVSTDIYRPAGFKQLEVFTRDSGVDCFSSFNKEPIDIVYQALNQAKIKFYDILLVDSVGCLHTDKEKMAELLNIYLKIKPIESLFVIDAMIGQDAANVAREFNQILPLTGVILTKIDSDTRGGAALSVRYITKKPIKFIGIGEKIDKLEVFQPENIVNRILGMDDILSLIKVVEDKINFLQIKKNKNEAKKIDNINLIDFLSYLKKINDKDGLSSIISNLFIFDRSIDSNKIQINDKAILYVEAIINSMTTKERINPSIIKGSHKRRIAAGAGVKIQDVNKLLKQFNEIQCLIKKAKKIGISKMMHGIRGIKLPNFPSN